MNLIAASALGVVLLASAAGAPSSGALPLRRGVYAEASGGCRGAASADKAWFGGGYVIQAPHARCEMKSVSQPASDQFLVASDCYEDGDQTLPFEKVDHITIVSSTEYRLENDFGRFRYRWCHG